MQTNTLDYNTMEEKSSECVSILGSKRKYSDDVLELHDAIKAGSIKKVKMILENYCEEKYFLNSTKESAASVALQQSNLQIYELLISKGVGFAPNEDIEIIMTPQPLLKKFMIRLLHKKYSIDTFENHLTSLMHKSKLAHSNSEAKRHEHFSLILEAYKSLSAMTWIEKLLKFVALIEELRIVFDFNQESVIFLDPTKGSNVYGTSQFHYICIGAKGLLYDRSRNHVLGTLAHELCHSAMQMLYQNRSKPYCIGELEKETEFEEVVRSCDIRKYGEILIKEVFHNYSPDVIRAELIVRVPHILAVYKDNPDALLHIMSGFEELFYFFEHRTLVDLELKYSIIKLNRDSEALNSLIGELVRLKNLNLSMQPSSLLQNLQAKDKCIVISSNCPTLTMISCYTSSEIGVIFASESTLKNDTIFDMIERTMSATPQLKIVINCDGCKIDEISELASKLRSREIEENVIFVINDSTGHQLHINEERIKISHTWKELSLETQKKLCMIAVNFQGTVMTLETLVNRESLHAFNEIPFMKLIGQSEIEIGIEIIFDDDYIDRRFLPKPDESSECEGEKDVDDMIAFSEEHGNVVLLLDDPGMGKTETFKNISRKLNEKNPSRWIAFLDLKYYQFDLEFDQKITKHERDNLVEHLTSDILKIEKFEAEVFDYLFKQDRVTFLMDGFDEVSPFSQKAVVKLAEKIRELSKNKLWISSRPHLENSLRNELSSNVFKLKPLSKKEQKILTKNVLSTIDYHNLKKTLKALTLREIDYISNPLLLKMMTKISRDKKLEHRALNMFNLYDELVTKIFEESLQKGPEIQRSLMKFLTRSASVIKFYQKQAFKTIFEKKSNFMNMMSFYFKSDENLEVEEVVKVGLMYSNDFENFNFIHKTFADYFIARFVVENIFDLDAFSNKKREAVQDVFIHVLSDATEFKMIQVFIDGALESVNFQNCSLNAETVDLIAKNEPIILYRLIENHCVNLVTFITASKSTSGAVVKLWNGKNLHQHNVLMGAACFLTLEEIEKLYSVAQTVLDPDSLTKMRRVKNFEGKNVLDLALKNDCVEVFDFFRNLNKTHPIKKLEL